MSWGRDRDREDEPAQGLKALLRSLLPGIPWAERAEKKETQTFAAPKTRTFRVANSNGVTRITGEDRDDIEVTTLKTARAESSEAAEALLGEIRLVFEDTGDRLDLEVEVPRKWNRRGTANLCIKLPRAMEVWVAAVNGRVDVEGIRGLVHAKSTNGSAKINDVIGDVEITTTNAKVSCSCTCGKLFARSSNGKIEIEQHRGSVDASTSNGLIRASLDDVGEGGVQLATSNGRIVLDLPEHVDADVDIRVDNGVIRNDRELCPKGRETNGRVAGRLGLGGKLIKLRTSNGSVSLH
jgi:putative adhesin